MAFLPLSSLFVINFVFSTVGQFFAPAETAMIPTVVPRHRLLQANSLFHLTFTASQLVGLVVLGPLLAKVGGVDGLFVGVPVVLGASGMERVIEIKLGADEQAAFDRSADAVRELVAKL